MNSTPPLSVIELRRYAMRPGRRDDLIALFEREFIDSQAAAGLHVIGSFREPDEPDRFTWLRGFADMDSRGAGLAAFYGGPVWQAHRDAANATMLDSSDVLLLRPSPGLPALAMSRRADPPRSWRAMVLPLKEPADAALRERVAAHWLPQLRDGGAESMAFFETEQAENNYPRLPVRMDGPVMVALAAWPGPRPIPQPTALPAWPAPTPLAAWLAGEVSVLTLVPTSGSPLA